LGLKSKAGLTLPGCADANGSDLSHPISLLMGQEALLTLPEEIAVKCGLQHNFEGQVSLKQIRENLDDLAQSV
jgi:hypothetical protein